MQTPSTSTGPPRSGPNAPREGGPVHRVQQHALDLVEDIKSWIDLKVQHKQLELQAKVESKLNVIILGVILLVLALYIFGLVLTAISLGLGAWLGHPAWGFALTAGLLTLIAGVLAALRPNFVQRDASAQVPVMPHEGPPALPDTPEPARLSTPPSSTRSVSTS
ncbi:MAG: phage holin family protein [Bacteroidota bacterium]